MRILCLAFGSALVSTLTLDSAGSASAAAYTAPQQDSGLVAIRKAQLQQWRRFPVFVWFESEGAPRDVETLTFLRDNDLSGCNVESGDSSVEAALVGLPFYVGRTAGKGTLHMRPDVLEAEQERRKLEGNDAVLDRPKSLHDPAVLAELERLVKESLERHAQHHPMAWALDDELSVTFGLAPFDYSFDEKALQGMRAWLQKKYVDLAHLNEIWEEQFESVSGIVPLTTEKIRERNVDRRLDALNFAPWSAHREYMDESLARVLERLTKLVEQKEEGVPVGFLGGQAPSAFGGFDWYRLMRTGSFFEAYDHGMAPRLLHSFKRPGTYIVSTLFLDEAGQRSDQVVVDLWRGFARGDDAAVVWSNRRVMTGRGGELRPSADQLARELRSLRDMKPTWERGVAPSPEVLVYFGAPSVRASWLLDSWADGATWINRLTSYETAHSTSIRTRETWGDLLDQLSVSWRFLDRRELLREGGAELRGKVLILNEAMALSDQEVHEILRFAAVGRGVIADAHFALFDEDLRGRDNRALTAVFGLRRNSAMNITDLAKEQNIEKKDDAVQFFGFGRGERSIVRVEEEVLTEEIGWRQKIGEGETLYLNLDLRSYRELENSKPHHPEALRRALADVLQAFGVTMFPQLALDRTCRDVRLVRRGDRDSGLFLLHAARAPISEATVKVQFAVPSQVQRFNQLVQQVGGEATLAAPGGGMIYQYGRVGATMPEEMKPRQREQ